MRHLPKHLRPRWRYLAVEIESWPDAQIDRGSFQRQCWYACQNLHGDVGSAAIDLRVLGFEFRAGSGEAVIRVRRGRVAEARAAIATVYEIDGAEVGIHVRGVSGTVRACEEKYLGRRPELLNERTVVFESAERPAVERNGAVDVQVGGAFVGATALDLE